MKILTKIVSLATAVAALAACSSGIDEGSSMQPADAHEVGFVLPAELTRTSLADDGMTTRWAVGDKLAVWAQDAAGDYTFENALFTLRYFGTEYDKAYFTSTLPAMAEGEYTYMLTYPTPKAVDGTLATYTLPAVQSGEYDGRYDVMVAEHVVAEALTSETAGSKRVELNTIMRHQMHALKITIPEKSSNFADVVYGVEVTFPMAVAGDIIVDVANPEALPTYTNTTNTITVKSDKGFAVGSDIWVFVLPGAVSGDVSYKVNGLEQRSEVATYPLERELKRGHVTPIRMAMPPFEKYTAFNFSIGENYLGEEFDFFTLYDSNGTNMGTYNRNAENRYTWEHLGEFDVTPYNNSTWTLVFDTKSAVVENKVNMGTLRPYYIQDITPVDVPYLLFENFDSIIKEGESYGNNSYSESEREQPGVLLDDYMTSKGWNAARFWLKPGAMRINTRRQCVTVNIIVTTMKFASSHHGRLDTPMLGGQRGIKPGVEVNVQVMYDAAMYKHTSSSMEVLDSSICIATHTNASNPIDGIPTGATGVSSSYDTTLEDFGSTMSTVSLMSHTTSDNAFGASFPTFVADISVTSNTRLCFYPTISTSDDRWDGNAEINVYIDNIKVSIAK